jgi:hypothetical protein
MSGISKLVAGSVKMVYTGWQGDPRRIVSRFEGADLAT